MDEGKAVRMIEARKGEIKYQKGFDQPTNSDGVVYRYVSWKYTRWVVNGRILEPGDPAEPKPQPIFVGSRPRILSLGVS